jgi:hypothetical protein
VTAVLWWAIPAAAAYAVAYIVGGDIARPTLRLAGACAIGALTIALLLWS